MINQLDGQFDQSFGKFFRIANRRRGENELRRGAIEFCHALSRRITLATCEPNTPRYVCISSITTKRKLRKKSAQLV